MEKRAARRLDHADRLAPARPLVGHEVGAEDIGIVEELAREFGRVQHLDHARIMVHERAMQRLAAADCDELLPFGLGERGRQDIAHLHAGQRPDAIPALFRAERLDVRELHVASSS